MSMELILKDVCKVYPGEKKGQEVKAVSSFNLVSTKKEFIVFVGPSGCGKSTTLRMIAGLEDITSGDLIMDGERMNKVEAGDRSIAMVFQNYALYPHMTAYENMAFGLKNTKIEVPVLDEAGKPVYEIDKKNAAYLKREIAKIQKSKKLSPEEKEAQLKRYQKAYDIASTTPVPVTKFVHYSKQEIDARIQEAAKILGIEELLSRKPKAMSGGQRQRVALGRAIVRRPKLFLLDEPLSNLDAKLRAQMRVEISRLYHALDATFIYVTHDQVEAMTMGDRIVVMRGGVVQQIDTPTALFDYPANRFVAGFLGTPQMNFFEVELLSQGKTILLSFPDGQKVSLPLEKMRKIRPEYLDGNPHPAILGIRPEHLYFAEGGLKAKATLSEILGSQTQVYGTLSGRQIVVEVPERMKVSEGQEMEVAFLPEKAHLFSAEGEVSILANDKGEFLEAPEVKTKGE